MKKISLFIHRLYLLFCQQWQLIPYGTANQEKGMYKQLKLYQIPK